MKPARLIVRRRIGDIETPVGALLKLGADASGSFLFESIAGGERLGRYSFIGLEPDHWFRIQDGVATVSKASDFSGPLSTSDDPVKALREFVSFAQAETDTTLPPMASGAFGYVGYDMIQHIEPVTITAEDKLNVPEALLVIPKVVIVFDHIFQEILLIGRVQNDNDAAINALLDDVEARLERLPETPPKDQPPVDVTLTSNTSKERYFEIVEQCRDYIRAGDIFQVVPSQRLSTPFNRKSISFYRALRRLNPSAFMFHMNLGDVRLVGSSPEILVRLRDGRVAIRLIRKKWLNTSCCSIWVAMMLAALPPMAVSKSPNNSSSNATATSCTLSVMSKATCARGSMLSTCCSQDFRQAQSPAHPRSAPCRSSTKWKRQAAEYMAAPSAISAGMAISTPASPCALPSSRRGNCTFRPAVAWCSIPIRNTSMTRRFTRRAPCGAPSNSPPHMSSTNDPRRRQL